MILYRLTDPMNSAYTKASRIGTWKKKPIKSCILCGYPQAERTQPLIIEWETGSSKIGDFTWPGYDDCTIVNKKVVEVLERHTTGMGFGPVEIVPNTTSRKKPSVTLPYNEADLFELWIPSLIPVDFERSSIKTYNCTECSGRRYEIENVEQITASYNAVLKKLIKTKTPRQKAKGIYLISNHLKGLEVFRVLEFPTWIFCTERVKDLIIASELTNIDFLEMGEVI